MNTGSSGDTARIIVRYANTTEILYSTHPLAIANDTIDISSYVDLTSTHIKLEIHDYIILMI